MSEAPQWLTANFLRDLLQISRDIELTSVRYACKKGENFASKIYRVHYRSDAGDDETVIVKSRPFENNGFSEEFLKKFNVFAKETETYELIGQFERILRDAFEEDIVLAPKCLKVTKTPTDILIIDDLCARGYEVAPKSSGLDLERMKVALRKLAQFHGSSAVHCEKNGKFDNKYSRGVYNSDMAQIFDQHLDATFIFILDEFLSTWPSLDKKIIEKMKKWKNFALDELIRSMEASEEKGKFSFNCLNHGDCWISNILFLNDENGNVKDCAFIDFQQSVYTSPAVDLLTLIITSACTETKLRNFDFYVKFYHESLVETLNLLGYSRRIPTLKQLYMDVIDRAFLGVWNSFAMLPTCLVENVEESSSDNLMGSDEEGQNYKKKLFNNERYRKHMTELLIFFDNRGLVDLC